MNNLVAYEIWAPERAPWSPWVKPVLFGFLEGVTPEAPPEVNAIDFDWLPDAGGDTVLVLDLSGAGALGLALKLAARGFRPVPLYNAIPWPTPQLPEPEHPAAVDVESIVAALAHATHELARINLRDQAPPAFLLDADRGGVRVAEPGDFDNRSVSFSTDFPSAKFLRYRGVKRALLVQVSGDEPALDLEHTLYAWQEGGINRLLEVFGRAGRSRAVHDRPAISLWLALATRSGRARAQKASVRRLRRRHRRIERGLIQHRCKGERSAKYDRKTTALDH